LIAAVWSLGGPKQRALLAALLMAPNRAVSIDRLIDVLWPAHPPAAAANALQFHVASPENCLRARAHARAMRRKRPARRGRWAGATPLRAIRRLTPLLRGLLELEGDPLAVRRPPGVRPAADEATVLTSRVGIKIAPATLLAILRPSGDQAGSPPLFTISLGPLPSGPTA
jgi:hypothetical protein